MAIARAGTTWWSIPLILVGTTAISTLSSDLYVPSMPYLKEYLRTDNASVQLTMSLNLAAYAVAQLVHGPLADRVGRKTMLIAGLVGFAMFSIACALAWSIESLITARIAQGLMSSVPSVVVLLVIRELYSGDRAISVMGFYGMAVGLAPAVGPLIGGYVFVYAGWRANFWLLVILAIMVAIAVWHWVPETRTKCENLQIKQILNSYKRLICKPVYLSYLIPLSAVLAGLWAFFTNGPFLLKEQFGVSAEDYGLFHAPIILSFVTGSFAANRFGGDVDIERLVVVSIVLPLIGAVILATAFLTDVFPLAGVVIGMMFLTAGLGLLFACGPLRLMDVAGEEPKGPASALLGAAQLGTASIASLIVGHFYDGSGMALTATVSGCVAIAAIGYFALRNSSVGRCA